MTIHDFCVEEQLIIKTGVGKTLNEFRRHLALSMEFTTDIELQKFIQEIFDKFRLVTEREWEEFQKALPNLKMPITEDDIKYSYESEKHIE